MAKFITDQIIKARGKSLEAGQNKYRAYFVNTGLYLSWKPSVDELLTKKGYEDCIVTE